MGKEPSNAELGRRINDVKTSIEKLDKKFDGVPALLATHTEQITTLKGLVAWHTQIMFSSLIMAVVALAGVAWKFLAGDPK